jgi:ribonuclease HI
MKLPRIPAVATSPIFKVGGRLHYQPAISLLSSLYVDGSYRPKTKEAAVAYYLVSNHNSTCSQKIPIKASNSTEAEWASIYFGLKAALENSEDLLHVQNDCLSVVRAFLPHADAPKQKYARHFWNEIKTLAGEASWVGISWIPRELNRADQVLR